MRRRHGLTQKQLGKKLGISPLSIVLWEYGDRRPAVQHIKRLCQVYCCQPKEIGYNLPVPQEYIDDTPMEETQPSFSHTPNTSLIEIRQRAGYTQWEVAQQVGVPAMMVSVWENEHANPSLAHLRLLCQVFRCPPEDIGYPIYPRYTVRLDDVYLQYTTSDNISCPIIDLSDRMR
jgi:DNA-binding XRE family transcriptional regulator